MQDSTLITEKIPQTALPVSETDHINWLRLIRSRKVGPVTFVRLVREYGSVEGAINALPEMAFQAGVKGYEVCSFQTAEQEWQAGNEAGAKLLCLGSPDYPRMLATINDAPPVLWAIGNPAVADKPCVAIVGARNASSIGRRMAGNIAGELSQKGFTVVSGLARGIDTHAHRASCDSGTIAVQAGGVDIIYPAENFELANNIITNGLRLSEMPLGLQPQARHFPRRNRIISGLAKGVIVIEAASRSGSLITARDAADQGREVMAVPGNPLDARASGCNMLIRDGATLVRSAQDVIELLGSELNPSIPPKITPVETHIYDTGLPARILALLGPTPTSEDEIIRLIEHPANEVIATLADLEMLEKISRHSGGKVSLLV